jgi:hypothetical protein
MNEIATVDATDISAMVGPRMGKAVLFPADRGAGQHCFAVTFADDRAADGVSIDALGERLYDGDVIVCDPDQRPQVSDLVFVVLWRQKPFFAVLETELLFWPVAEDGAVWKIDFSHMLSGHVFSGTTRSIRGVFKVLGKGIEEH